MRARFDVVYHTMNSVSHSKLNMVLTRCVLRSIQKDMNMAQSNVKK